MTRQRAVKSGNKHQLRIIGGKWRSRVISFADAPGLRPTGDRIRETLFNWLAPHIQNARCLDAFAGSGALGFEALSRGARDVVFIEKDREAIRQLIRNKAQLNATDAQVINDSFLHWLESAPHEPFHIIFLDPPFADSLTTKVLDALLATGVAGRDSLVYTESSSTDAAHIPAGWRCIKDKTSGGVRYQLLTPD